MSVSTPAASHGRVDCRTGNLPLKGTEIETFSNPEPEFHAKRVEEKLTELIAHLHAASC